MEQLLAFMASPAYAVFVVVWLLSWVGASIIVLKRKGETIIPRVPADAIFVERGASGRASGLRALGGASNCLLVFVDRERLRITAVFPFNLAFLPQVWGLDVDVKRSDVIRVDKVNGLLGAAVVVNYRHGLDAKRITLQLRDPAAFERAFFV